jgi:fatty acid/phospholipid biosynthesis enzyme
MGLFQHLMGVYDIASLCGGVILGIEKIVVKAHGACDEKAIVSTVGMVLNMAQNKDVFDRNYAEKE